MPNREEIKHLERTMLEKVLREQYDLIRGPWVHEVLEKDVRVTELMRSHDTSMGPCHKDYVITRRDYKMKLVFRFEIRTQMGTLVIEREGTVWFKIIDEQKLHTEWHCEPGVEELPRIPENYCLLKFGETIIWSGNPSSSITIHFEGKSPTYKGPPRRKKEILGKRYAISREISRRSTRRVVS